MLVGSFWLLGGIVIKQTIRWQITNAGSISTIKLTAQAKQHMGLLFVRNGIVEPFQKFVRFWHR